MTVHTMLEVNFYQNEFSTKRAHGTLLQGFVRVPKTPLFWGGHTSKTFGSGQWFWRYPGIIMPKNSYFKIYIFKTVACSKNFFKCDPPKSGVSKAKEGKVLGSKKFFEPPQNTKKLVFSKNWNYMIWLSIVGTLTVPSNKVPLTILLENSFY